MRHALNVIRDCQYEENGMRLPYFYPWLVANPDFNDQPRFRTFAVVLMILK